MTERSHVFKAFQKNMEEHARIERVLGDCIASIDETICRSGETVSETRELLVQIDKQFWAR
jgi:hypothetical protein